MSFLEKDFCKSQVSRMSQLTGFPAETEAKRELVCALQMFATEQQASKYIDGCIANEEYCPKPVAIRRSANMAAPETRRCELCDGVGFRSTVRLINGQKYDFAVPCKCHAIQVGA